MENKVKKVGDMGKNILNKVGQNTTKVFTTVNNKYQSINPTDINHQIGYFLLLCAIFLAIVYIIIKLIKVVLLRTRNMNISNANVSLLGSLEIIDCNTQGHSMVDHVDDTNEERIKRSDDKADGLEFSYSFWLYLNSNITGEEKILIQKGQVGKEGSSLETMGPKIGITQEIDKVPSIYFEMDTFSDDSLAAEVHNLPINKWIHIVMAVNQENMDIYINGVLTNTKQFINKDGDKILPRQNNDPVHILPSKSTFSGYMSKVYYHNTYINVNTITDMIVAGPAEVNLNKNKKYDKPGYLSNSFFMNNQ